MTAKTLIGLACLIANKGPLDTAGLEAQLSEGEKAQIQKIIDFGVCLPDDLEKLIRSTQEGIDRGDFIKTSGKTVGCTGCVR